MKAYDESMYWMRNDDWFRINHEKDCFELTDAAPERAVESFQLYLINNDKQAMASAYKAQIAKYGVPISHEQYDELRQYAKDHSIRLSGFRSFVGEISVIKTIIDDISEIAADFPPILDERTGIVLELDYGMKDEDFATTDSGHIIHLNGACFADLDSLKESYLEGVQSGHFVQGTDWRAIARHETGHVVDNIYRIEPLELGMEILGVDYMPKMYSILKQELSEYSAMYIDGREIVSESFAGYYGKAQNKFANAFVMKCKEIAETAKLSSIHGGDTMKRYDESMYWMDNDDWFRVNYEKDGLELTPEAPPRAVESFELYLMRNDLPVEDRIIPASAMGRKVGAS